MPFQAGDLQRSPNFEATRWQLVSAEQGKILITAPAGSELRNVRNRVTLVRSRTSKGCKSSVFEPALRISEACCTHPGHLVFNRSTMIFLLAKERIADLLFCSSKCLHFAEPVPLIAFFQCGCGAENLFSVHEHSSWQKNIPYRLKQRALRFML